ncbi:MAG: cupredoxin domain-containing protein [Methanomicrobiales archaeon]|nr:cupredoxin domain-containing protein [Methanomicrobiales archaeon]
MQRIFGPLWCLFVLAIVIVATGCVNTPPVQTTPTPTITPPATTTLPTTTAIPATVTIELQAFNGAFSPGTIEVPACSNVTIRFINYDVDIPHNFALYTGPGAQQVIYQGEVILGSQPFNYTFQAPCAPGTYFFRDDRHPTMLTGSFVVR